MDDVHGSADHEEAIQALTDNEPEDAIEVFRPPHIECSDGSRKAWRGIRQVPQGGYADGVMRTPKRRDPYETGKDLLEQPQSLDRNVRRDVERDASKVAAWLGQALDQADRNGITHGGKDHRNVCNDLLCCQGCGRAEYDDHIDAAFQVP